MSAGAFALTVVCLVAGIAILAASVVAVVVVHTMRARRRADRSDLTGAPSRLARRDLPELDTRQIPLDQQ